MVAIKNEKYGVCIFENDTFSVIDLPDNDQADVRDGYIEELDRFYTFAPSSLEEKLIDDNGEYITDRAKWIDYMIYGYVDDNVFYTYNDKEWNKFISENFC